MRATFSALVAEVAMTPDEPQVLALAYVGYVCFADAAKANYELLVNGLDVDDLPPAPARLQASRRADFAEAGRTPEEPQLRAPAILRDACLAEVVKVGRSYSEPFSICGPLR